MIELKDENSKSTEVMDELRSQIQQKIDFYSNSGEEWQDAKVRAYSDCLELIEQLHKTDSLVENSNKTTDADNNLIKPKSHIIFDSTEEYLVYPEETTSFPSLDEKYYAKIKGWELVPDEEDLIYWNVTDDKIYVDDNTGKIGPYGKRRTTGLTLKEWAEVGIKGHNADFEKVEK